MNLPEDLQRGVEEARAIVRFRFPWWLRPFLLRGVVAITLGRRIYLQSGIADLRLLRHELAHVRQIQRLGLFRFYRLYACEYVSNRRRGWPSAEAYRRISLEIEAFAAEGEESV
jgi:hypothetical protein